MKRISLALALFSLAGCSALGLGGSSLDAQSTAANLSNVKAIVATNATYLDADAATLATLAARPASVKKVERDANAAAVQLAESMNASAGK